MIVDAIERWVRGEYVSTPEQTARALRFIEGVAEQSFRRVFLEREANDAARPPISGSSRWQCRRHLHHSLKKSDKGDKAPRAYNAFWLGDMVEALVVAQAIMAGVDVVYPMDDGTQYESEMVVAGETIRGHVDMVVRHPQYGLIPVEVKSQSEYGWNEASKKGMDNTFGYIDQLGFYVLSMGAPRGLFVGVNKSTGKPFEEWHADHEFRESYYQDALSAAKAGDPGLPEWATDRLVRGVRGSPSTLEVQDIRCSYCDFRGKCWEGYERTMVAGKVKWRKPLSADEAAAHRNGN